MSYEIKPSDSAIPSIFIDALATDTSTSLTLFGRGHRSFGEAHQNNFYHLLENFASYTAPTSPVVGQLWFDKSEGKNRLTVCTDALSQTWVGVADNATQPGFVAPLSPVQGQLWFDLGANMLKVYDGSIWVSLADQANQTLITTINQSIVDAVANRVIKTGDTLSGIHQWTEIDSAQTSTLGYSTWISGGKIELGNTSVAASPYLDFHSSGNSNDYDSRIIASGGSSTGTGSLTVVGNLFLDKNPTQALQAATKQYVDSADLTKVNKSGDVMTGQLTVAGLVSSAAGILTTGNVDCQDVHTHRPTTPKTGYVYLGDQTDGARYIAYDATSYQLPGIDLIINGSKALTESVGLKKDGSTVMTGLLTLSGAPTSALHAVTKAYADTKLPLAGGTLGGPLLLSGAPSQANEASTKAYVDGLAGGKVAKSGDTMSGNLTVAYNGFSNSIGPTSLEIGLGPATTPFIDFHSSGLNTDFDVRLIASGGASPGGLGTLDVQSKYVNFFGQPTVGQGVAGVLDGIPIWRINTTGNWAGLGWVNTSSSSTAKSCLLHFGGDPTTNELRFGRYGNNGGGFEGNPFVFGMSTGNFAALGRIDAASFGNIYIKNTGPSIHMQDQTAGAHGVALLADSDRFYVLPKASPADDVWTVNSTGHWPLEISMVDNSTIIGGNTTVYGTVATTGNISSNTYLSAPAGSITTLAATTVNSGRVTTSTNFNPSDANWINLSALRATGAFGGGVALIDGAAAWNIYTTGNGSSLVFGQSANNVASSAKISFDSAGKIYAEGNQKVSVQTMMFNILDISNNAATSQLAGGQGAYSSWTKVGTGHYRIFTNRSVSGDSFSIDTVYYYNPAGSGSFLYYGSYVAYATADQSGANTVDIYFTDLAGTAKNINSFVVRTTV